MFVIGLMVWIVNDLWLVLVVLLKYDVCDLWYIFVLFLGMFVMW